MSTIDLKEYHSGDLHFFSCIFLNNESFTIKDKEKGLISVCLFIVNYHINTKVFHTYASAVLCNEIMNDNIKNMIDTYFTNNYTLLLSKVNDILHRISSYDESTIDVIENPSPLSIIKSYHKQRKKREDHNQ